MLIGCRQKVGTEKLRLIRAKTKSEVKFDWLFRLILCEMSKQLTHFVICENVNCDLTNFFSVFQNQENLPRFLRHIHTYTIGTSDIE